MRGARLNDRDSPKKAGARKKPRPSWRQSSAGAGGGSPDQTMDYAI
jgi:hypothetical protein